VRFVELDQIFHQAGWSELSQEDFRTRVTEEVAAEGWVVDGNYSAVRDLVWQRADTVVWLDLRRRVVVRRVAARTLRRSLTREQLWNGNREPLSNFYRWDPQKNIVRWAWLKYPEYSELYGAAMEDPQYAHIRFIRLATPGEIDALLDRP
jgi:hypothetical protein